MEQINYSVIIQDRKRDFASREWVFRESDAWLNEQDGESVFLLTGEPGTW